MENFEDQTGITQVEMNRLLQGFRQRKLLNLERWQVRRKTDAVEFAPIAGVRHDGLQGDLKSLAVAESSQLNRPAIALLEKGEHGIHGVELHPIDGENLVAGLQTRFRCRHSRLDLADADRILLHAGHKADGVKVEIVRSGEDWEPPIAC